MMIALIAKETIKAVLVACAPVVVQQSGEAIREYLKDKRKQKEEKK